MEKINSSTELKQAILLLEQQHAAEEAIVKEQFLMAYESVKPVNLIKNTIGELTASEEIKSSLANAAIGVAVGYISKFAFIGFSRSPVRKLMGAALMYGVSNYVEKHPENVKAAATVAFNLFKKITTKLENIHSKTED